MGICHVHTWRHRLPYYKVVHEYPELLLPILGASNPGILGIRNWFQRPALLRDRLWVEALRCRTTHPDLIFRTCISSILPPLFTILQLITHIHAKLLLDKHWSRLQPSPISSMVIKWSPRLRHSLNHNYHLVQIKYLKGF